MKGQFHVFFCSIPSKIVCKRQNIFIPAGRGEPGQRGGGVPGGGAGGQQAPGKLA